MGYISELCGKFLGGAVIQVMASHHNIIEFWELAEKGVVA